MWTLSNLLGRRGLVSLRTLSIMVLIGVTLLGFTTPVAEARSNTYCVGEYYNGFQRQCGQNLQPACNSGPSCDSGFIEWSGEGFPYVIDCPTINHTECIPNPIPWLPDLCTTYTENIPDVTISSGCFDDLPTCNNCGGNGQPPCPPVGLSCTGCDEGTILSDEIGLCLAPSTIGEICDISVGCAEGLLCDPDATQCFTEAQAGDSCVILPCADGLQCTLAFECANASGGELGQTCDAFSPCGGGLFCKFGFPSRCALQSRPGEQCNALLTNTCVDGSFCFPNPGGGSKCMIDPYAPEITAQRCETFYSPQVANPFNPLPFGNPIVDDRTRILGAGISNAILIAESTHRGVAYGQFGEFGCFNSVCEGIELDAATEAFVSTGSYNLYTDVGGESTAVSFGAQLPGSLINGTITDVIGSNNQEIGVETAVGIGIGFGIAPITPGVYSCTTELITLYGDGGVDVVPVTPVPGPAPAADIGFGAVQFDGAVDRLLVSDTNAQGQLSVDEQLTIELWIRPTTAGQTATLIENPGQFALALDNGDLTVRLGTDAPGWSTAVTVDSADLFNELRWTHVALTYAPTAQEQFAKVYVNGALKQEILMLGPVTDALPSDNVITLGNNSQTTLPFAGLMQQVRLWSIGRSANEIARHIDSPVDPLSPGLLAAWTLSEPEGEPLTDRGPNAITLAQSVSDLNPSRATSGRGVIGGALHFDGIDDHVGIDDVNATDQLIMSNALTIEAWVHPLGPGNHPVFGGIIAGKEGEYYIARNANGNLFYAIANASPGWASVTTSVQIDQDVWTHVALTYSPADEAVKIYLNGTLAETDTATGFIGDFHPTRSHFRIGGSQTDDFTGSEPLAFHGLIDEVRVWRRARSEAEISATYQVPIDPSEEGELAGWWRFDEGGSNAAIDSSLNGVVGQFGLGKAWRYPQRVHAAAYTSYPLSLASSTCNGGECSVDADNDGSNDYVDNCLLRVNVDQIDADGDGFGNACDPDFDNSGAVNFVDYIELQNAFQTSDPLTDLNDDGVINFLDFVVFQQFFLQPPGPSALRP